MNLWKLSAGCLILLFGLIVIVYNELIVHEFLGRTVTGFILVVLGVLILLLKKENVHYAFFIAAVIAFIKLLYGLYETYMKMVGFIISDLAMVLILAIIGFCIFYWGRKSKK